MISPKEQGRLVVIWDLCSGKYSTDSSDWIDEVMEYALKIQQDWQDSRSTARALAKEMLLSRIKLRDHSEMYPGL